MTLLSACVSIIQKSNDALSDASGRLLLRIMFKCPRSCLMTLLAKGELREHILLYIRHCVCCDHVSGGPRQGLAQLPD